MRTVLVILLAFALNPTDVAHAQQDLMIRPGCKLAGGGELTHATWTGMCRTGYIEGEGVLKYKTCDDGCQLVTELGVWQRGNAVGLNVMYVRFLPPTNHTSDRLVVSFYNGVGEDISNPVMMQSKSPTLMSSFLYKAKTSAIVKGSEDSRIGDGLSPDEVFSLVEDWNTGVHSDHPTEFEPSRLRPSQTAAWYREREAKKLASAEHMERRRIQRQQFADQRRDMEDARRKETARAQAELQVQTREPSQCSSPAEPLFLTRRAKAKWESECGRSSSQTPKEP